MNPQYIEAANGVLVVLFLGVIFVFVNYIVGGLREHGWREGYHMRRAAISCAVLFFGDWVIRTFIWLYFHEKNDLVEVTQQTVWLVTIGSTAGVVICIVGCVCILRHFAPARLGNWPSIVTVGAALLFGIGMAL